MTLGLSTGMTLFRPKTDAHSFADAQVYGLSTSNKFASMSAHDEDWIAFKHRFITSTGRVIDTGNGGISHSEGQGYGLLFAVTFNDQATFGTILRWTQRNLALREDSLHAWRFDPRGYSPIEDLNNATDGDIFIAAALSRAARRWHNDSYAAASSNLSRDILDKLVTTFAGRTLLMPGAYGFEKNDGIVINPSYYAFPLFADLAWAHQSEKWEALHKDGVTLIKQARFGRLALPADWVMVSDNGALSPAPFQEPRFSDNAIRVILNLAWSGDLDNLLQKSVRRFRDIAPNSVAWIDLRNGSCASYQAAPGMRAILNLALASDSERLILTKVADAPDYYSSALILMVRIAAQEKDLAARRQQTSGFGDE